MSEHTRPFSRRAFVGGAAAFGISLCLPPLMPAKAPHRCLLFPKLINPQPISLKARLQVASEPTQRK